MNIITLLNEDFGKYIANIWAPPKSSFAYMVKILVNFFYLLLENIADRMSACYVSFFVETQIMNTCAGWRVLLGWRSMDTLGCRCDWRPSDTNHIKGDDFRHTPPTPSPPHDCAPKTTAVVRDECGPSSRGTNHISLNKV